MLLISQAYVLTYSKTIFVLAYLYIMSYVQNKNN